MKIFTVDGTEYRVKVPSKGIKRKFSVLDTSNSGRSVTGDMIRDIIGTYYNYTIEIYPDKNYMDDYYLLYNILSSPTDSHYIEVPYNNGKLGFNAYITSGNDSVITLKDGAKWEGLSLNFISMSPQWRHDGSLTGFSEVM